MSIFFSRLNLKQQPKRTLVACKHLNKMRRMQTYNAVLYVHIRKRGTSSWKGQSLYMFMLPQANHIPQLFIDVWGVPNNGHLWGRQGQKGSHKSNPLNPTDTHQYAIRRQEMLNTFCRCSLLFQPLESKWSSHTTNEESPICTSIWCKHTNIAADRVHLMWANTPPHKHPHRLSVAN